MRNDIETQSATSYEQMGIAALLPGMRHMITLMQEQYDSLRQVLQSAQQGTTRSPQPTTQAGRAARRGLSGWPADPEARREEMHRRMAVGKKNREARAREARA